MKHFDGQEWLAFQEGRAGEEKERRMEEHLTICEDCRQVFLGNIDTTEIDMAKAIIPPDFTAGILNRVQVTDQERISKTYQLKDRLKRRLFSYYVAAAAVTLMLMSGGVFQSAAKQVSSIPMNNFSQAATIPLISFANWPDQLREKAAGWMDVITWKNHKEVK